jgi:hypothetical protein
VANDRGTARSQQPLQLAIKPDTKWKERKTATRYVAAMFEEDLDTSRPLTFERFTITRFGEGDADFGAALKLALGGKSPRHLPRALTSWRSRTS